MTPSTKAVTVIAGQGAAPRLATLEQFKGTGGIPAKGIEPAAVPAALDACLTLLDRFGTMTFTQVIAPTKDLLRHPTRPRALARRLAPDARDCSKPPRPRPIPPPGSDAPKADRSRGLRLVADAFYRGPIARRIDAWSRAKGSLIRYVDLATHTTRIEEPVSVTYRGLTVYKCGAWTQGPACSRRSRSSKAFDLKAMGHNRPEAIHTIAETIKLAMADRDTYYADPHFADVPLAEPSRCPSTPHMRRALIDPKHASLERRPGDPRSGKAVLDPAADPAGGTCRRRSADVTRHDDLPGRRPVRQRRRGHAQRLVGRRGRRHRRLAGQPAPELQHLGGPSQRHRARQAPADHPVADARAQGKPARAGRQRRRRRQPGPDDLAAPAQSHRFRPRAGRLRRRSSLHVRPFHQLVPADSAGTGAAADQSRCRQQYLGSPQNSRPYLERQYRIVDAPPRA